jgi:hypothetical protein
MYIVVLTPCDGDMMDRPSEAAIQAWEAQHQAQHDRDSLAYRALLTAEYDTGLFEEFDSLHCGTPNQALETAWNLLWAALEDDATLQVRHVYVNITEV